MPRPPKNPAQAEYDECLEFMHKRLFKESHKRQDVADRKQRNRDSACSVVKSTWSGFCKHPCISDALEIVLREVNRATAEAYLLANLHVMRMITLGHSVGPLDQSFFYGCLSAVSVTERVKTPVKDMHFRESVELYWSWRPVETVEELPYEPPDSKYLASGFYQNLSLQMVTNTKTSTRMQFFKRFKRYLRHKHALEGKAAYELLRDITADEYEGDDRLVLQYRAKMPVKPLQGRCDDYPHLVMPLLFEFLDYFESAQQTTEKYDKQLRLFTLLPTKQGFDCSHVKICTNGLHGLLKRAGLEVPREGSAWRAVAEQHWRELFNVAKYETATRKFAGEILTDGKAVSIVLRKPKRDASTKPLDLNDYDEVWGLDPGRTDMFVACNEEGDFKSCSSKQFYEEAMYKRSTRTIQGWHDREKWVSETNSLIPSKKTTSLDKLRQHVEFVLPRMIRMMQWHMRKPFRKLKLRRYIFAQKKLRQLCRDITSLAGKRTLVGFGDWSCQDSAGLIKKAPGGPVKRLENQLKRYCKVVPVDEFRSSKLHHDCGQPLHHQYSHKRCKDKVVRTVKVHSVLFCRNRSCRGMTMNRDENAARNLLALLRQSVLVGTRPLAFSRGVALEDCLEAPWTAPMRGRSEGRSPGSRSSPAL